MLVAVGAKMAMDGAGLPFRPEAWGGQEMVPRLNDGRTPEEIDGLLLAALKLQFPCLYLCLRVDSIST